MLSWGVIETVEIMVMNLGIPLDLSNILLIESSTIIALFCISGILVTYLFLFNFSQNITDENAFSKSPISPKKPPNIHPKPPVMKLNTYIGAT